MTTTATTAAEMIPTNGILQATEILRFRAAHYAKRGDTVRAAHYRTEYAAALASPEWNADGVLRLQHADAVAESADLLG